MMQAAGFTIAVLLAAVMLALICGKLIVRLFGWLLVVAIIIVASRGNLD